MGIKGLLLEMAVYGEDEVFAMNPVIAISSKRTEKLEDNELIQYVMANIKPVIVPSNYRISNDDIGIVIRHHCGHRKLKKAALLTIPYVINSNLPTAPWRRKTDENGNLINTRDKRLSAMMSAPIQIDGTKYLCNLTLKKGKDGIVTPYALTLKDASGNIVEREKMDSHCQVLDNNSEPTTNGNAHLDTVTTSLEANPSMSANITKSNNNNENKTYKNMKKNVQRINENQLRAIVAESVKKVLNEDIIDGVGYADGLDEPDKGDYEPMNLNELLDIACDYLKMCDDAFKKHNYEEAYNRFKQGYRCVCSAYVRLEV